MKPEESGRTSRSVSFGVAFVFLALTGLALLGGSVNSRPAEPPELPRVEVSPAGLDESASASIRADDSDRVRWLPGHSELDLQLD
jgi:hypothetical protein